MKNSFSESYKAAGVDVTAGYEGVRLMKKDVERTNIPGVLTGIGGFGGLFQLDIADMKEPVLVSGTDGVGTKLKLAMLMDKHDTIGIDAVAMCVNDIICCGAKPLYFLDYIAIGKNVPEKVAAIVKGVADGCVQSGCALIGGETAEHPGMMPEDEYDIAGYSTGVVDKSKIIDNSTVKEGDIIIGLASTGVHSNGFSLVRKVFNINSKEVLDEVLPTGKTLGETLLTPTKIYVKNVPRSLPDGFTAKITKHSYEVPYIFKHLQEVGNISEHDMYNTFNMGIGMTVVVDKDDADEAVQILRNAGVESYCIGEIIKGDEGIIIE